MENSAEKQDKTAGFFEIGRKPTEKVPQVLQASISQQVKAVLPFDSQTDIGVGALTGKRKSVIDSERLLQNSAPDMDEDPMERPNKRQRQINELQRALMAISLEDVDQPAFKANDSQASKEQSKEDKVPRNHEVLFCRVGVRLPNGQRVQNIFLRSDPIQLLWPFCCSQVKEAADGRQFRLVYIVPGASEILDYGQNLSFADSGVPNSLISMIWE